MHGQFGFYTTRLDFTDLREIGYTDNFMTVFASCFLCSSVLEFYKNLLGIGTESAYKAWRAGTTVDNPVPKSVPSPNKIVLKSQHWIFKRRGGVEGGGRMVGGGFELVETRGKDSWGGEGDVGKKEGRSFRGSEWGRELN